MNESCERCIKKPKSCARYLSADSMLNCDVYASKHNFIIYAKPFFVRFHTLCGFSRHDNLPEIDYNTKSKTLSITIEENTSDIYDVGKITWSSNLNNVNLRKLNRITDLCRLTVNGRLRTMKFEANFNYGYNDLFRGEMPHSYSDTEGICKNNPHMKSPVFRQIELEIEEEAKFKRDGYKLNMIELQIPEGHDDPMTFKMDYSPSASELTIDEEHVAHNICRKAINKNPLLDQYDIAVIKDDLLSDDKENGVLPCDNDFRYIDCGLVSILLAICYDIRFTSNEPNCESGSTRNQLSATLSNFDKSCDYWDTVVRFLRRTLIFTYYSNYELGCLCVQDVIDALETRYSWILKQLLITHEIFDKEIFIGNNRDVLNHFYIRYYILLMYKSPYENIKRFKMIAAELKIILANMHKKYLRFNLLSIDKKILDELLSDIRGMSDNDSDYSDTDNAREMCDDSDYSEICSDDDDDDDDAHSLPSSEVGSYHLPQRRKININLKMNDASSEYTVINSCNEVYDIETNIVVRYEETKC